MEVRLHLRLDTGRVNVLVVDVVKDVQILGTEALRASDLDVKDTGVAFVARNGVHSEAVGVFLSAHESTGPGEPAILGGLHVDLVTVQIGPVPVPVDGVDVTSLEVSGELYIRLAGELFLVNGSLRLELVRTSGADLTSVGLVALAVVIVTSSDELAALVAASTLRVPEKVNIEELLLILGLGGAVEVDSAAVLGLLGLVLGESGVAILKVHNSNVVASSGFKHGKLRVLVELELVQNLVARVSGLTRLRQNVLRDRVGKGRVGRIARHKTTRVSHFTDHGTISSEFRSPLNPGVSRSRRDERASRESEARGVEELHVCCCSCWFFIDTFVIADCKVIEADFCRNVFQIMILKRSVVAE